MVKQAREAAPVNAALDRAEALFRHRESEPEHLTLLARLLPVMDQLTQASAREWPELRVVGSGPELLVRTLSAWLQSDQRPEDDPLFEDALARLRQTLERSIEVTPPEPDGNDRLDALRKLGKQRLESLMEAEGGLLTATEMGRRLGITPQAVNQRRRKGLLLGLLQGRSVRYPAWQVDEAGQVLTGLEPVLEFLRSQPPAMVLQFLLRPHPALGNRRPLDVLRAGVVEPVIEAASEMGEQGAS